jgi:glycosyltransferase involved in cell wall biosynthesis
MTATPRVTVGLPVYNGERHLAQALDALLGQTFENFELVVSDNASTDRTEEIARDYAARDRRVRYVRQRRNVGAIRNFNGLVPPARGTYFRWAAADDLNAPESLARCVEVLDRLPAVVLTYPKTRFIDAAGRVFAEYEDGMHLQAPRPGDRFRTVIREVERCNAAFGLIRTAALRRTGLFGAFVGSDVIFLAELSLQGTFWEIPEYLFFRRFHDAAASRMTDAELREHYQPGTGRAIAMREWRHLWERARAVARAPIAAAEKARLGAYLLRSAVGNRDRLWGELASAARTVWRRGDPTAAAS